MVWMQTTCRGPSTGLIPILLLSICVGAARGAPGTPLRLAVPRASGSDPLLASTLLQLKRVARARDAAGLRELLAPDVRWDEQVCGPADIGARFGRPSSGWWERLARVVELGGAIDPDGERRFLLPWAAACWPAGASSSGRVAVVVPRAHLLEEPSQGARVRAVVGNEVLRLAGAHERATPGWVKVRTPGRIYGYVRADQVWSPTELVVLLEPRGPSNAWTIVALEARGLVRGASPPFTIPRVAPPAR